MTWTSHGRAATTPADLTVLMYRVRSLWDPVAIWLFGSRARGDARPTSDWDLMIIVPDDTPDDKLDPSAAWELQRGSGVYADLVCCRESAFEDAKRVPNTLAYEVSHDGKLVWSKAQQADH